MADNLDGSRLLYTVAETVQMLGVGRSTLYVMLGEGKLDVRKVGRRTLITAASIRAFVEGLPGAQFVEDNANRSAALEGRRHL